MFRDMKISVKILLVILIMSLGSLLFIFGASYYFMNNMVDEFEQTNITLGINSAEISKNALLAQAEDYLYRLVEKQAQAANEQFYAVNRIVTQSAQYTQSLYENSSNFVGKKMPRPDETQRGVNSSKYFLAKDVTETPEVAKEVNILSSCEYMFAPFLKNNPMLDNIYIGTKSGISYRYSAYNEYNPDYDPRKRDWYKAAMASPDKLVWLPTYTDSYGTVCITAAMSYRNASGDIAGVVASDVLLTSLIEDAMKLKIGDTGSCFILDAGLNFIAHPDMDKPDFKSDLNEHINSSAFIEQLKTSSLGIKETSYEGHNSYIAFSKLSETGWIFCASIETQEVTAPAVQAKAESDRLTETSQQQMQQLLFEIFRLFMIFFAVIGIAVIMLSFAVSGTITRPIEELAVSVQEVGEGNFDQKIAVTSKDEVGQLANRFNEMQDNLKNYLENLKKVTAEKERIGAELNVATQIQADMLPKILPPYLGHEKFEMFATMNPAKEVGGDFYDFFLIDDDHLALVMADVSGKGVPAALFMVIAKTLIKNRAFMGGTPGEILADVNNQLCEGNEADLFVTVWLGILELSTGKVIASNAGHEYPAIKRADGKFELFKTKQSPAVATMEGIRFRVSEFELNHGDCLYVYTDGVPEATNIHDELFGTDRMLEALDGTSGMNAEEVLHTMKKSVDDFTGEAPQFDDVTMLYLKFLGGKTEDMHELVVDAQIEKLDEVLDFVDQLLDEWECPMKTQTQINIAVEEIFVNIAHYAYKAHNGQARITITRKGSDAEITFTDSGTPYNPLEKPDPDVTLSAEERDIGGLGIYIVKKSMDTVSYEHRDNNNVLTISKRIE